MTVVVRDPEFYEPTEDDDCTHYWYYCQTHSCDYRDAGCQGGPAHLIALHCRDHGPESMWPQPRMLMLPAGFTPPLSDEQLAWIKSDEEEDAPAP